MNEVIKTKGLSIATMLGGAVVDMVDEKLQVAGANISDPNTEAEAIRKIILEIAIKPHGSREMAEIAVKVDTKLAGDKAQKGSIFVSRTAQGQTVLTEKNGKQLDLEEEVQRKTAADVPRVALATSGDDDEN